MSDLSAPSRPRRLLYCERMFGVFFLLWGLILQVDNFVPLPRHGVFFTHLELIAPGWVWGVVMIVIALARYFAWRLDSARWRLGLSSMTLIFLWIIAGVAFWEGLWGISFPLAAFAAIIAQSCHRMLARDIELGL